MCWNILSRPFLILMARAYCCYVGPQAHATLGEGCVNSETVYDPLGPRGSTNVRAPRNRSINTPPPMWRCHIFVFFVKRSFFFFHPRNHEQYTRTFICILYKQVSGPYQHINFPWHRKTVFGAHLRGGTLHIKRPVSMW